MASNCTLPVIYPLLANCTKLIQRRPKRPESRHPLPVQTIPTVQTLDALIPARATQASRAGHFIKSMRKTQLHSLLHIKVLRLVIRIKQAYFKEAVFC